VYIGGHAGVQPLPLTHTLLVVPAVRRKSVVGSLIEFEVRRQDVAAASNRRRTGIDRTTQVVRWKTKGNPDALHPYAQRSTALVALSAYINPSPAATYS
jgi:hypothetical protein